MRLLHLFLLALAAGSGSLFAIGAPIPHPDRTTSEERLQLGNDLLKSIIVGGGAGSIFSAYRNSPRPHRGKGKKRKSGRPRKTSFGTPAKYQPPSMSKIYRWPILFMLASVSASMIPHHETIKGLLADTLELGADKVADMINNRHLTQGFTDVVDKWADDLGGEGEDPGAPASLTDPHNPVDDQPDRDVFGSDE